MDTSFTADLAKLAKLEGVIIKIHKLIYSVLEDIKNLLEDGEEEVAEEIIIKGTGIIKEIFEVKLSKTGIETELEQEYV